MKRAALAMLLACGLIATAAGQEAEIPPPPGGDDAISPALPPALPPATPPMAQQAPQISSPMLTPTARPAAPGRDESPLAPDQPAPARLGRPLELAVNPLWSIPLAKLTATRERPLFLPSRRPPAMAAAAVPATRSAEATQAQVPARDTPALTLVGTIGSERFGIGIFVDEQTKQVVRLKTGDIHDRWMLTAVRGREVQMKRDDIIATLGLPTAAATAAAASAAAATVRRPEGR